MLAAVAAVVSGVRAFRIDDLVAEAKLDVDDGSSREISANAVRV